MIGFCPLASGSKGNCLYFGTDQVKILIDAGISLKATTSKLNEIGVDLSEIDAIFITHDHGDHIAGLKPLISKYSIPVFANHETAKGIIEQLEVNPKFKIFSTGETFEYLGLEIHPFSIPHDTLDPVAFTILTGQHKFGICADLGYVTSSVRRNLKECDYLYLEANHQVSMVHACSRPMVYKNRVLGKNGHLSNEACGHLLQEIAHDGLKHVHLAHLSSECNTHETCLTTITEALESQGIELNLSIAYQDKVSLPISSDFFIAKTQSHKER
jgi:phosphoribosyl 1,2-cyclic phosphodiesterase